MRRRDLIAYAAGAAAWPFAAGAQPLAKRRLIATLTIGSAASGGVLFDTFRRALGNLGYGDDKVAIESRWADGHADRLPALAAALVRLSPDVIVAAQSGSAVTMQRATTTIPIVFAVSDDPVAIGLVASLAHPGGNITGMSFVQLDTVGKQLQLLTAMAPGARRVAVLTNPGNPGHGPVVRTVQQAAASLPIELIVVKASNPTEIDPAFTTMGHEHVDAVLLLGGPLVFFQRSRIIALAASHRLPALYHDHIIVEEGGLMSYGPDLDDNYRGAASLVAKILNGAKPADLPVAEPTKFYLYVNRKTAAALGLTLPPLLEAQADRVVE
jgi:putative ABC transport system substrate-binding protein